MCCAVHLWIHYTVYKFSIALEISPSHQEMLVLARLHKEQFARKSLHKTIKKLARKIFCQGEKNLPERDGKD